MLQVHRGFLPRAIAFLLAIDDLAYLVDKAADVRQRRLRSWRRRLSATPAGLLALFSLAVHRPVRQALLVAALLKVGSRPIDGVAEVVAGWCARSRITAVHRSTNEAPVTPSPSFPGANASNTRYPST